MDFVKGPIELMGELVVDKIQESLASMAVDFVTGIPILIGVSVAVYALVGMFSSRLAKLGVVVVFIYGALVVIF